MTNKDLLYQYANTGAILNKRQVMKLPKQILKSYLRRRIIQATNSPSYKDYYLSEYEFEGIESDMVRSEYLDMKIGKQKILHYYETPYLSDSQIVDYVKNHGDYPATHKQEERIRNMDPNLLQELLVAKAFANRYYVSAWQLELMSPRTFEALGKKIILANRLRISDYRMPDHLDKPYLAIMAINGFQVTEKEVMALEEELVNYYIECLIQYNCVSIEDWIVKLMNPIQLERYNKIMEIERG